jgi:hypothetical protein
MARHRAYQWSGPEPLELRHRDGLLEGTRHRSGQAGGAAGRLLQFAATALAGEHYAGGRQGAIRDQNTSTSKSPVDGSGSP